MDALTGEEGTEEEDEDEEEDEGEEEEEEEEVSYPRKYSQNCLCHPPGSPSRETGEYCETRSCSQYWQ